jgi:alpha-N-acetylglucosamine transferase
MTKGYLLIANNTDTIDYVKLAYICALSIKYTQPKDINQIAVVTTTPELVGKLKCSWVFDQIIEYTGPVGMASRSRAYNLTPYDETVLLDSDMMFLKPMNHYWYYLNDHYLCVANNPQNYKEQPFKYGYYRKVFEDYQLPDVYNAWTYFKKDPRTQEFFDLVKLMTDNPDPFIKKFLPESGLKTLPTDEAFALAIKILDIEDQVTHLHAFPPLTHMKPMVQGWQGFYSDWRSKVRFTMDRNERVRIGVWPQRELCHYVDKDIISQPMIEILESNEIWNRTAESSNTST